MLRLRSHPATGLPVLCDDAGRMLGIQLECTVVNSARPDESVVIVKLRIGARPVLGRTAIAVELDRKAEP